jgi:YggT family protein
MYEIVRLLVNIIWLYQLLIIVRVLLSWTQMNPYSNPFTRFLSQITDPFLDAVRRAFPFLAMGGIDLSPIVILFILNLTARFIIRLT